MKHGLITLTALAAILFSSCVRTPVEVAVTGVERCLQPLLHN